MGDIAVDLTNWGKLRRATNAFIPLLVLHANDATQGFTAAELYRAGNKVLPPISLSQHLCGKALNLEPINHAKAQEVLLAYAQLEAAAYHGPLQDEDIVIAMLGVPTLGALALSAGFKDAAGKVDQAALSAVSGVSVKAIHHALNKGRVTAGIANALHTALAGAGASVPSIHEFAVSDYRESIAYKTINDQPFRLGDLLLPLPTVVPNPWP